MTLVVIVGGGLAGLSCAVRCAESGLDVTVLEAGQDESYLCNSRLAMGFFNVAFRDIEEPVESLRAGIDEATGGVADAKLAECVANSALPALSWLKSRGVRIRKGTWRRGTHNMLYPPAAIGAGLRWPGRGGDQMLRRLEDLLLIQGGRILRGWRAISLEMHAGTVRGVHAESAGKKQAFSADAVVIADGGFQSDQELMREHISSEPERLVARNAGTGRGDGLRMALAAGAGVCGMEAFYGHLQSRDALHNSMLWPYPVLDHLAAAGIVVDASGRRICDEGRGGIAMANTIARLADPLSTVTIFDHKIWKERGTEFPISANPMLVRHNATLHVADDLSELAAKAGLPADALAETVGRYNTAIARGSTKELEPARSVAPIKAWPIATSPFYAAPIAAAVTYTMGGIRIGAHADVISTTGETIPGLYAVGSATGGLEGGPHAGYTGGLSKALITGWLAGTHLSGAAL